MPPSHSLKIPMSHMLSRTWRADGVVKREQAAAAEGGEGEKPLKVGPFRSLIDFIRQGVLRNLFETLNEGQAMRTLDAGAKPLSPADLLSDPSMCDKLIKAAEGMEVQGRMGNIWAIRNLIEELRSSLEELLEIGGIERAREETAELLERNLVGVRSKIIIGPSDRLARLRDLVKLHDALQEVSA